MLHIMMSVIILITSMLAPQRVPHRQGRAIRSVASRVSNLLMARPMISTHKPGVTVIPPRPRNLMEVHPVSGTLPCGLELLPAFACFCSPRGNGSPTFFLLCGSCTNDMSCSSPAWCRLLLVWA